MSEITASLGIDELVMFAMDDWANQLALSHKSIETHQTSENEQHAQDRAEKTDVLIARTVENLFDLLPGIRAERRAYFYDEEIQRADQSRGQGTRTQTQTLVRGPATMPIIEKQFKDAKLVYKHIRHEHSDEGRRKQKLRRYS
jgi:hypothetical protein